MKTKRVVSLWLFVFSCAYVQGQTDTTRWDNLGDPTDPNCVCYNVQLTAEKEYQQLQMKQRKSREDSLLALHERRTDHTKKRMRQNEKRKKRMECPTTNLSESTKNASALIEPVPVCAPQTGDALSVNIKRKVFLVS